MAYRASTLTDLLRIRKAGQRPDMPVVVADNPGSFAWGKRNGFCTVDRRDVGEDLTAFAGLDAFVITKAFLDSIEFAKSLAEECRFVTLIDANHRRRSEFL